MPKLNNNSCQSNLINIVGIDGAGKSTLARNLTEHLQAIDHRIHYKYCQYLPKLLLPLKYLAKISVMRNTDEFKNYGRYNTIKKKYSARHRAVAAVYALLWIADYILQISIKVALPLLTNQKLIVDRYIYDNAINISLTTNNDINYAYRLVSLFSKFVPLPQKTIFIDLNERTAFRRKNDIQSIDYLAERRERYLKFSKKYGFYQIDGNNSPEKILEQALNYLMQPAISQTNGYR